MAIDQAWDSSKRNRAWQDTQLNYTINSMETQLCTSCGN
jgi:hypothetical protein